MVDLPEEEIEVAEARTGPGDHGHDHVTAEDGTLVDHLRAAHGLEVEDGLSPATSEGLHDRLHDATKAADD